MTGLPPHLQHYHHHSDDDLSRASPAASLGDDGDFPPYLHSSSLPHHGHGPGPAHPHLHSHLLMSSDDDDSAGEREDGKEDVEEGDGEITRLRTDYEKGLQRSQKAFSIRLENLKKSRLEKEESHKKQLEKHLRDMADFERKVRTAEREQIMRLKELEEQWRAVKTEHRERRRLAKLGAEGGGSEGGELSASTSNTAATASTASAAAGIGRPSSPFLHTSSSGPDR